MRYSAADSYALYLRRCHGRNLSKFKATAIQMVAIIEGRYQDDHHHLSSQIEYQQEDLVSVINMCIIGRWHIE